MKQYYSENETVTQFGSRECSFKQYGLKQFFEFTFSVMLSDVVNSNKI